MLLDALAKQSGLPGLSDVANKKTSDQTDTYNCIAWAFGDDSKPWWPNQGPDVHWPIDAAGLTAMEAFEAWFVADGWIETADHGFDPALKKVALYALNGNPTHAARLISEGVWTSKLGRWIDLSHAFDDLNGPAYGAPIKVYQKLA